MSKISKASEAFQKDTLSSIGQKLSLDQISISDLQEFKTIAEVEISPSMCGPVGIMFSSVSCKVEAGFHKPSDTLFAVYNFRYEHSNGGSNGYRVEHRIKIEEQS